MACEVVNLTVGVTYPATPFNPRDYYTSMISTVFTYRISSRTLNTTIPVTNTP